MKESYNPKNIEEKWLKVWEENNLFQDSALQEDVTPENKMYLLFAFAYPSGSGLHVGHVESKTALDILARYYRRIGKKVFFPVGWDAFGLPAENYAIKTGVPPATTTKEAINTFKRQIKRVGISYDWSTEIATCHPEYYKWTQWLFLQLYKKGLAFKKKAPVNWCPSCQTVLANEQVVNGTCERCGTEVIQKEMAQWFFKITDFKDELINDLAKVDWPEPTKQQQLNWIGKSEGALLNFKIFNFQFSNNEKENVLKVFTTRPDTIFGATFMVVAPEHPIVDAILKSKNNSGHTLLSAEEIEHIQKYVEKSKKKTEEERMINKDKTGVFSGVYVTNPANNQKIPVYISDYVLMGYGTGAIMAVPAHDDRDFAFATKFNLSIIPVVKPKNLKSPKELKLPYVGDGILFNSDVLDGIEVPTDIAKVLAWIVESGLGKKETNYKLRDWLVSRQRYWGPPIPIVYDEKGNEHPVKEEHLPWLLPVDVDFNPTGESPLKSSKEFKERVEKLYGKGWTPEYDTLDTFVDSSWYYLRYADARNNKLFADKNALEKWMPVDLYMIGSEHTVLHLLYSRFITKFLRNEGYLNIDEPFQKMRHQGMILGPDNKKMSKSKGNVINPDDVVGHYGADTLRVYEMFMGPIDADKPWNENSVQGVYRFLNRVWDLCHTKVTDGTDSRLLSKLHQTIRKVSNDIQGLKYNTAIASMMKFVNMWGNSAGMSKGDTVTFLHILAPFAPFITEELYNKLIVNAVSVNNKKSQSLNSIHLENWPVYNEGLAKDEKMIIPVQVNGKRRGEVSIESNNIEQEDIVIDLAKKEVSAFIPKTGIKKQIYVKGRIVNFVV